uniref:Zinc finger C2HC-type containing 1B n=1 Tax=Pseudonaja textilis TaxID=8673 RepID=A0A670XZY6_PSETE
MYLSDFKKKNQCLHNPICKRIFNKKRKPFNSLKQRLQGTDIPTVKKKPPTKSQPIKKKSNWRQQHEDFISAIRAAKLATRAMKEGRPLPPPPPPSINPDYIQCPYCMRRFNQTAAERHINFCKEQAARRSFAPGQKGGKPASVIVRTQYYKLTPPTTRSLILTSSRLTQSSILPRFIK